MNAGYGSSGNKNKVFFTLKVKKGNDINAHMEVRRWSDKEEKYVVETSSCRQVSGKFAGIDHRRYRPNEQAKEKDAIIIYLVNEAVNEVYVIQSSMNSHARNIMNTMFTLFYNSPGGIKDLNISVWDKEKNGVVNANCTIRHDNPEIGHSEDDMVGWYFDWEKQKELITFKEDDFNDYYKLEKFLLEKWLGAKAFLEKDHPHYKALLESIQGKEVKKTGYTVPDEKKEDASSAETPPDNIPDHITGDDEDDLPF